MEPPIIYCDWRFFSIMKLIIKSIAASLLLLYCLYLPAEDVFCLDGMVYRNVENFQHVDDYILFDKDGRSFSFSTDRVKKVVDSSGRIVYERVERVAQLSPDNNNLYIFKCDGREVGRGKWLDAGIFQVIEGNIPDGVYSLYYDSGELKRTFTFKDGALNGPCNVYFRSGKINRDGVFKNGRLEGESHLYYPDGTLKGVSYFQNGLKSGPTKLYYESGRPKADLRFKDGRPDGQQIMYYENGQIESKVSYNDGIKNGPVLFYYESGKIKMQGKYVNDVLDGTVTTFYESGRVKRRKIYNNGRILQQ